MSFFDDIEDFFNPRGGGNNNDDDDDETTSSPFVEVTTMTAPQTFDGDAVFVTQTGSSEFAGGAIAGGAIFASRTSSAEDESATFTWETPASESIPQSTADSFPTTEAVAPPTTRAAISAPTGSSGTSSIVNANAQASAQATSAESEGLSGGAKAGIAFGILIPFLAILIGALIYLRRKKQQKKEMEQLDDEKLGMSHGRPPAFPNSAASSTPVLTPVTVRSVENLAAPRLSLRPQTQFDPRMSNIAGPNGAMAAGAGAAVGAAAVAAAATNRSTSPQQSWPNEKSANDPANPFGNHAETMNNSNGNLPVAAAAIPKRASSPVNIDAADFPLPGSIAPSERAISLQADNMSETASIAPSNPATASNLSLAAPGTPTTGMAAAAAAAGVAGAAAAAGASKSGPPPADNVYRVQLDFKPSMEDELDIRAGQLVRLLHAYDDGWALCMRMDRSQQGVVPRTCLSKNSVKPRQGPPPQQGRPGPGPRGPNSPAMRGPPGPPYGRPMTPQGGRNSPAPYGPPGSRPMTPQGQRPMTPQGQRPMTPQGQRPMTPQGQQRPRANSNAGPGPAPYAAYNPQARSMSPGPYMQGPPSRPDAASRTRSNSMGAAPPPKPLSPSNSNAGAPGGVARKPVPGQS